MPKSFAIRQAETVSLWIAYPLHVCYLLVYPLNWLLDRASRGILSLFGVSEATHGSGESAKYWLAVLTELKNRGVRDVFFLVCDGLKGLPDSVATVFPDTTVQTCVIHLIRGTFKFASPASGRYPQKKYWQQLAVDMKRIYTAPNADAAWAAFEEFEEKWAKPYPAIMAASTQARSSSSRASSANAWAVDSSTG